MHIRLWFSWYGDVVKALFLGGVAADTGEGIKAQLPPSLAVEILDDPIDLALFPSAAAEADILVSNHWRADYPPAPKVRLVQSVATGVDLFDMAALPKGVIVCNAFGHETAIAEYVLMTMLALHHRLFEISGEFRERASWRASWVEGGEPHGELRVQPWGLSGMAGSGARWRAVRRRSAAVSLRPTARRASREPALNASIHSTSSTKCCPIATLWRCAPRSVRKPPG